MNAAYAETLALIDQLVGFIPNFLCIALLKSFSLIVTGVASSLPYSTPPEPLSVIGYLLQSLFLQDPVESGFVFEQS